LQKICINEPYYINITLCKNVKNKIDFLKVKLKKIEFFKMDIQNQPIFIKIHYHCQEEEKLSIDTNEKFYILKEDDKTFKMTKKGVKIFLLKRFQDVWEDIENIIFICSGIEKYIFASTNDFEEDYKNEIEEQIDFFLEFQLETFL